MKALEVCRRLFLLGKQKMCFFTVSTKYVQVS